MSSGGWTVVAVAGVTAAYALVSRRLSSTPLSSAIVFVGAGILLGPAVLDIVDLEHDAAPITALLETTLTLVLFTDAMTVRRRDLAVGGFLPGRLLAIGLPLSIGAGWLLAWPLLPGLTAWELALVGAILAPTDAALGKTAMSSPRVPALGTSRPECGKRPQRRHGAALLRPVPGSHPGHELCGRGGGRRLLARRAEHRPGSSGRWAGRAAVAMVRAKGWVTREWRQVYVLAVAAAAYGLAVVTEGGGFIAAWVAGFAFGFALRRYRTGREKENPDRTAGPPRTSEDSWRRSAFWSSGRCCSVLRWRI